MANGTITLSERVFNSLQSTSEGVLRELEGNLLTLLDGIIQDKEQRESAKSLARRTIVNPIRNELYLSNSYTASIVYDFMHRKDDEKSAESLPGWHYEKTARPPVMEMGVDNIVEG